MKFFLPAVTVALASLSVLSAHGQAVILPGSTPTPAASVPAAATGASATALAPVTPVANPNALKVRADVNPATGRLVVRTNQPGPTRIEVTDAAGRPVITYGMMNGLTPAELNVSQLPAGAYLVRCTANDKTGMRRVLLGR